MDAHSTCMQSACGYACWHIAYMNNMLAALPVFLQAIGFVVLHVKKRIQTVP